MAAGATAVSRDDWATQRIPRTVYEHLMMPSCQKIGTALGIDPSTSAGRIECLEHIFRMFLDLDMEILKREL